MLGETQNPQETVRLMVFYLALIQTYMNTGFLVVALEPAYAGQVEVCVDVALVGRGRCVEQ